MIYYLGLEGETRAVVGVKISNFLKKSEYTFESSKKIDAEIEF